MAAINLVRRRVVLLAAIVAVAVTGIVRDGFGAEPPPNVLLILVDDLKPALGCYGDAVARTPHLDALAARGMRFDLAYCNQAVCAPSRFTLMLGAHSTSTGLYGLGSQLRQAIPDAVTMPQHFARHGYRTESLGKVFHIGHGNAGDPDSFSVEHFKEKVIEYVDPASTVGGQLTREEAFFTNQRLGEIRSLPRGAAFEAPDVPDESYADGRVAAEAIRRLQAARVRRKSEGTPFFIAAGFARPHLPFCAPKKYWDLFDPAQLPAAAVHSPPVEAPKIAGKTNGELANYAPVPDDGVVRDDLARQLVHGYYASTSFVDAQIGKVLDELNRLELAENTIVVLWGDHGFHLGDHGYWTKHTNYEQANRIPLVFAAPGVTQPGSSTRQPTESVDIYPTLCELAGLPAPTGPQAIDGVSLVPVLRNPSARVREYAYHAYPRSKIGRAIRTERYRLVEWKLIGEPEEAAELELYDYQSDPDETRNVAAGDPQVVAELRSILARHPDPVDPEHRYSAAAPGVETPRIDNREIAIDAIVRGRELNGVVLAQGGREHGYALHFIEGVPALDVRVRGQVARLPAGDKVSGNVKLSARITAKTLTLTVNGVTVTADSPGLIPVQPKDELSLSEDTQSAAGDYEAPNRFTGRILSQSVQTSDGAAQATVTSSPPAMRPMAPRAELIAGLAAHDRALYVKRGWIRDPYIVLAPDGYYYLTGTTPNPNDPREESDPYNTGLGELSIVGWKTQVWRSGNLLDWESLGTPFTLQDGVWATASPEAFTTTPKSEWKLWAPELHWLGDRWALVHTSPAPVKKANLALSAGAEVSGPWSHPMGTAIDRRHDPSLFKDDDGTWWLIWGATTIAPLKPDFTAFADKPTDIGPTGESKAMGHEGCLIQKISGKYVLFGTGWSTGEMRRGSYNLYYAVADKITGPYSERRFAGRFLGHGTPFQDQEGRWWCTAFYNGNVPPLAADGIESRDIGETAHTINEQGLTLVPLEVSTDAAGEPVIRAIPPAYRTPGPDEKQQF